MTLALWRSNGITASLLSVAFSVLTACPQSKITAGGVAAARHAEKFWRDFIIRAQVAPLQRSADLAKYIDHFNCRKRSFGALVACMRARSLDSLIERIRRQDAECDRNSVLEHRLGKSF